MTIAVTGLHRRSSHTGGYGEASLLAAYRPGVGRPKSFDAEVQDIASAAHRRGVVLVQSDRIVGAVEAAVLCRTLRTARERTRGDEPRHDQVARIAHTIALRLGAQGAVQVSRGHWNVLTGYARRMPAKTGGGR